MHVETGVKNRVDEEVGAETEGDDGDDELQDADGDPARRVPGDVLLAGFTNRRGHFEVYSFLF